MHIIKKGQTLVYQGLSHRVFLIAYYPDAGRRRPEDRRVHGSGTEIMVRKTSSPKPAKRLYAKAFRHPNSPPKTAICVP